MSRHTKYSYRQWCTTLCWSSLFVLQLLLIADCNDGVVAAADTGPGRTYAEITTAKHSRLLQAGGGFSDSSSSESGGGSGVGAAVGAGILLVTSDPFFRTPGGIVIVILVVLLILAGYAWKSGKFKGLCQKNEGDAPDEAHFFETNDTANAAAAAADNDDEESGNVVRNFDLPFYSGLYTGFYDQRGARMPIQPFEIYFQETTIMEDISDDDDDDIDTGPDTKFHIISGKGADLVGPYSLSGKSVGNKVSITKKYYRQGNTSTDLGHTVTLRLDKLGPDSHIFEGKWFVHTEEVNSNGMYQIWPVGFTMQNNAPPPPMAGMPPPPPGPDGYQQQQQGLLPPQPTAIAVAASVSDDEDPVVIAVATATPVDDDGDGKKKKKKKKQDADEDEDY